MRSHIIKKCNKKWNKMCVCIPASDFNFWWFVYSEWIIFAYKHVYTLFVWQSFYHPDFNISIACAWVKIIFVFWRCIIIKKEDDTSFYFSTRQTFTHKYIQFTQKAFNEKAMQINCENQLLNIPMQMKRYEEIKKREPIKI